MQNSDDGNQWIICNSQQFPGREELQIVQVTEDCNIDILKNMYQGLRFQRTLFPSRFKFPRATSLNLNSFPQAQGHTPCVHMLIRKSFQVFNSIAMLHLFFTVELTFVILMSRTNNTYCFSSVSNNRNCCVWIALFVSLPQLI